MGFCIERRQWSRRPTGAIRAATRLKVRVDDLPITGVIALKGNKKIGAEANAYVLTIPLDPLRHGRIHNQTACIEPLFRLDRPPLHVKECVLRKAFFERLAKGHLGRHFAVAAANAP